jgi:hypothetical protein
MSVSCESCLLSSEVSASDHSTEGILPSVLCLSVIWNLLGGGGDERNMVRSTIGRERKNYRRAAHKIIYQ